MTPRGALFALALALLAYGTMARPADTGGVRLRDFEAYDAAGTTWRFHGDPYSREIWRAERAIPGVTTTRDEVLPFVGPPYGLPLWDALARLPWAGATLVWGAVLALAFGTLALASARLAGANGFVDAVLALALAASFSPVTGAAGLGQSALVAAAAVAAWPLALGVRTAWPALICALVAGLQPNMGIVLAVRLAERRAWIAGLGAATVALGGSIAATASAGGLGAYATVLRDHVAAERFIAIQFTPAAVARGFGATPSLATALGAIVALFAVAAIAWPCFSKRYAPNDRLTLACAALPLAWPFAHEHDLCLAFVPALAVARRATGRAWPIGAVAVLALSVDWLGLAQRPGAAYEAVPFVAAAALAYALFGGRTARVALALAASAALVVALAAIVAAAHPLPTWPNALPREFSVVRTLGIAEVWHLEQAAAGIARLDACWAALRAIPLAACVVLWLVALRALRRPLTSASGHSEQLSTRPRATVEVHPSV